MGIGLSVIYEGKPQNYTTETNFIKKNNFTTLTVKYAVSLKRLLNNHDEEILLSFCSATVNRDMSRRRHQKRTRQYKHDVRHVVMGFMVQAVSV